MTDGQVEAIYFLIGFWGLLAIGLFVVCMLEQKGWIKPSRHDWPGGV